ncbi:type III polyketide synthase [Ilumatobacter sp.]|uniref:type III polyketide synthase n=1 Tax=Ilumatobacter sp. TaxID=1967498 RepID=UPI003B516415
MTGPDAPRPARVLGVGTAVPRHHVGQDEARDFARRLFADHLDDLDRLLRLFGNVRVDDRWFAVDPEWFETEHGLEERNEIYRREAVPLSVASASAALHDAAVAPDDVDAIFFVSSTGFATPSLDAVLVGELGLRCDVRRDATFGHGCAGGAGGLARAAQWARANPGRHVLVVATELCGLTLQRSDVSRTNLVATSLFADGSASVVVGTDGAGPSILAESSVLWPGTGDVMGWTFGDTGMGVVLSRRVPAIIREHVAESVDRVCAAAGVGRDELSRFVLHPGGAAVLDALRSALDLDDDDLVHSRRVLRDFGNMSAPTVLFVLDDFLRRGSPDADDLVLVSAMGPGFAAEHLVLRCDGPDR